MASIIGIYKNNPTAGSTDGTEVSAGGTYTSPIQFSLSVLGKQSEIQKLAIRATEGYTTAGTTTISDSGDTGDRIQLCWTEDGEYSDSISTSAPITNSNVVFYIKGRCSSSEYSRTDRTTKLIVSCLISQV